MGVPYVDKLNANFRCAGSPRNILFWLFLSSSDSKKQKFSDVAFQLWHWVLISVTYCSRLGRLTWGLGAFQFASRNGCPACGQIEGLFSTCRSPKENKLFQWLFGVWELFIFNLHAEMGVVHVDKLKVSCQQTKPTFFGIWELFILHPEMGVPHVDKLKVNFPHVSRLRWTAWPH